jgi:predicted aconitase
MPPDSQSDNAELRLSPSDQAMAAGEIGETARIAMGLLVRIAGAVGAPSLIDISGAHIDACLYHGMAGLDFALALVDGGGEVRVPATLNVSSLDLLHPGLYRGPEDTADRARRLMDAYVAMGCVPTWTCAPYQLAQRPGLGEQVAWGESNAIVFANSVLGARTGRYGDFVDIACALTGRAPYFGLHTDRGRLATIVIELDVEDDYLDDDLLYPLLGHVLGGLAGMEVPVILGLDRRASEDRLKALGAAAASSGAVAMFHAVGVTPEAPDLAAALGGGQPEITHRVGREELRHAFAELNRGRGRLGAVSVGTPHYSRRELERLATMVKGKTTAVPFYVNTSRDVISSMRPEDGLADILAFGATLVSDTCTYITPIMDDVEGIVLTDSGKWAFYAPGNLGVAVGLADLAGCVESAVTGRVAPGGRW